MNHVRRLAVRLGGERARWRVAALALRWGGLAVLAAYYVRAAIPWLQYLAWYGRNHIFRTDLAQYYAASLQGLRFGWDQQYNLADQQRIFSAIGPLIPAPNVDTPAMAWFTAPLTLLSLPHAYALWSALLLAALLVTAWLAAPDNPLVKVVLLAAALTLYPVVLALSLGQTTALLMAAVAICYWSLRRGHQVLAGLVLAAALALHPQDLMFLPLALLAAGRRSAFLATLAGGAAIAVAVLVKLGPGGLGQYAHRVLYAQAHPDVYMVAHQYSLPLHFQGHLARYGIELAILALTLVTAWRQRASGVEIPIAAGVVGSLMAASYVHLYDYALLLPAAWLVTRMRPHLVHWLFLAAIYWVLFANSFGQAALSGRYLLGVEVLWFAYLLVFVEERRPSSPERGWPSLCLLPPVLAASRHRAEISRPT